jgi:hypothetical protein
MKSIIKSSIVVLSSFAILSACSSEPEELAVVEAETEVEEVDIEELLNFVFEPAEPVASECAAEDGISYICGVLNGEDLLSLGDTGMILVSGLSNAEVGGHMYLVNPADNSAEDLIFDGDFTQALDSAAYPNCPGPLDLDNFSVHGLALKETAGNQFDLYITSHGTREAIEIFDIDMNGAEAAVSWKGCVVMPANSFFNSVAILDDGGFVSTKFTDENGFAALATQTINGGVFEWHPGGEVLAVAGTELSGANGITLSDDERYMYVAAFGSRELVKFDRSMTPVSKEVISMDITLDNIRKGVDGKLLTAGNNYVSPETCSGPDCATGWSVIEVDAETLATTRVGGGDQNVSIQGVSSALQVGNTIWVGTFNGDRVGYFTKQ